MENQYYQEREFYQIIEPVLRNTEFQRRKTFLHHQDTVYEHSLKVAWVSYKIAKAIQKYRKINMKNVVIGGLLHDFYVTPWRDYQAENFLQLHGFVHGKIAAKNAFQIFPYLMNERITDSIQKHMFPLTVIPPKYLEGWIITMADKYVSLEIFRNLKELPRYFGIHFKKERIILKCKNLYQRTECFVSHMY